MKTALLFCLVGLALALPNSHKEFTIRLDEKILQTTPQQQNMLNVLRKEFNMEVGKIIRVGRLRFVAVTGDAKHTAAIGQLKGIIRIEPNVQGTLCQVCEDQAAPGCYGLDRVDQRDRVGYTNPASDNAMYTHGEREGEDSAVYVVDTGKVFIFE